MREMMLKEMGRWGLIGSAGLGKRSSYSLSFSYTAGGSGWEVCMVDQGFLYG